jgi:hypothetical protein
MSNRARWEKHALYVCTTLSLMGTLTGCSGEKLPPQPLSPVSGQLNTGFEPLPGTDPNFVDPNFVDPNFVDPNLNGGFDAGVDAGFDGGVDPNALPTDPNPPLGDGSVPVAGTDPTFNPTDDGVIDGTVPGGEAPVDSANNPYVGDNSDDGSDLLGDTGGLPNLGGDVFGSEPPAVDPTKGNTFLGIVKNPKAAYLSGLASSGNLIYLGHYNDCLLSNDRYIRSFNLADGTTNDVSIYSQFRDGDNPTRLISGISVANGELWATLNEPDGDGFNVFRYSSSGSKVKTYTVGNAGLGDIAVTSSKAFIASPADQGVVSLDIQSNQANLISSGTPAGLGVDKSGNVYVTVNGEIVKYDANTGSELLRFGGAGKNGTGKAISTIGDVAVDPNSGDIYVVSGSGPGTVIARYTSGGNFIHSFGDSNLSSPQSLAVGSNGHVYINDTQLGAVLAFDAGK